MTITDMAGIYTEGLVVTITDMTGIFLEGLVATITDMAGPNCCPAAP